MSGLERLCHMCGYPLLFLGLLLIRRLPCTSLRSEISTTVHLFLGALSFPDCWMGKQKIGNATAVWHELFCLLCGVAALSLVVFHIVRSFTDSVGCCTLTSSEGENFVTVKHRCPSLFLQFHSVIHLLVFQTSFELKSLSKVFLVCFLCLCIILRLL